MFKLVFYDERSLFNSFDATDLESNLPTKTSTVTNNQLIQQGQTLPPPTVDISTITNSAVPVDILTNQIAAAQTTEPVALTEALKIDSSETKETKENITVSLDVSQNIKGESVVIAEVSKDENSESIKIEVKDEVLKNAIISEIASAETTPLPEVSSSLGVPVNQETSTPSAPVRLIPEFRITDNSFTIIRNESNSETKDASISFSFDKLFDEGFSADSLTNKTESTLLSRFIDFAKSISRVFQPTIEYVYGAEDIKKDKSKLEEREKVQKNIQEKSNKINKPSAEERKQIEDRKIRDKQELARNEKTNQNIQQLRANEEMLKYLIKKV